MHLFFSGNIGIYRLLWGHFGYLTLLALFTHGLQSLLANFIYFTIKAKLKILSKKQS